MERLLTWADTTALELEALALTRVLCPQWEIALKWPYQYLGMNRGSWAMIVFTTGRWSKREKTACPIYYLRGLFQSNEGLTGKPLGEE